METVLEVLKVTILKAMKPFLEEVDIVFDHSIYSRALWIQYMDICVHFATSAWGLSRNHGIPCCFVLFFLACDFEKADYEI